MEYAVDRGTSRAWNRSTPGSWLLMSDGELLLAIADGSREAFEEFHGRYHRAMLGLALSRLRDRGMAVSAVALEPLEQPRQAGIDGEHRLRVLLEERAPLGRDR